MKESYPCLLLLNDIHISKDNIPAFRENWSEALRICRKAGIRQIALGGDLFFSRAAQSLDVLLAVHDALEEARSARIEVVMANGNHDKVDQEALRGYCHVFDTFPNVRVVDDYLSLTPDEHCAFVLHMMGYFPEDGSFAQRLERLRSEALVEGRMNYLYIHEGINGALAQPSEKELPTHIFADFDCVLVGHYHNRCVVAPNIEYIGASRQHNFGEDDRKGYTLLYSDGKREFVPNGVNERFRTLDIAADQIGTRLADLLDEIRAADGARTRVRIHGTPAQTASIRREQILAAGAAKVEIVENDDAHPEASPAELLEKFDERKIRDSYRCFCAEKRIADVELGLYYLKNDIRTCGN